MIALRWVGDRSDGFLGGGASNERVLDIIFELTSRQRCQMTESPRRQILSAIRKDLTESTQ